MDDFATMAPAERREIIAQAATDLQLDFTIVEKDFWVCWVLHALFTLPAEHTPLIFKGGTSLSKAYGLIKRFSEDIDVVTDVSFFIARGGANPEDDVSMTQRHKRIDALDHLCTAYIRDELLRELRFQFAQRLKTRRVGPRC